MTFLRAETNINEIIHTYAPTAQFKCCCDSAGSDTKSFMKRAEKAGQVRANTTWDVFVYLHGHMPKPDPRQSRLSQFKITERNNFYVVRQQELTAEMQEWMQKPDHNVVFLRESIGEKKGHKITGIRSIYQIRAGEDMEEQCIMYRNITCACSQCLRSNYHACLTNSTWTPKLLQKEADEEQVRAAEIATSEVRLHQAALQQEERSEGMFAIIGNVTAHWEARTEHQRIIGQKRGQRLEKRQTSNPVPSSTSTKKSRRIG